jgi:hypothetical protein
VVGLQPAAGSDDVEQELTRVTQLQDRQRTQRAAAKTNAMRVSDDDPKKALELDDLSIVADDPEVQAALSTAIVKYVCMYALAHSCGSECYLLTSRDLCEVHGLFDSTSEYSLFKCTSIVHV